MELTLADDGIILSRWDVEEDFGNVQKPIAKQTMANEIAEAIIRNTKNADNPQETGAKP